MAVAVAVAAAAAAAAYLSGYFDIATPAWLTCQVNYGRPEGRACGSCVHQSARLVSDLAASELPQRTVEGHAGRDGVCKLGSATRRVDGDAGAGLLPPVVAWQAERLDGRAAGVQVGDFLGLEVPAGHHVGGTGVDIQRGVAPRLLGVRLGGIQARVDQLGGTGRRARNESSGGE